MAIKIDKNYTTAEANAFTGLTDTPSDYVNAAEGDVVKINDTVDGLSFGKLSINDLDNVDLSAITDGDMLVWDQSNDTFTAVGNTGDFTMLSDTPSTYTGAEGHIVTVNSTGNGLVFGASMDSLMDVDVTGVTNGQVLQWSTADSKWLPADSTGTGSSSFIGLNDSPLTYTGAEGKIISVNNSGDGVVFEASINGLTDVDSNGIANGQILEWSSADGKFVPGDNTGSGGSSTFISLDDTPTDYIGSADKFLMINSLGDAIVFDAPSAGLLSDVDLTGIADGEFLVWNTNTLVPSGTQAVVDFIDLVDTPVDYVGSNDNFVKVNTSGDSVIFTEVDINELSDVDTTGGVTGEALVLQSDGVWKPSAVSSEVDLVEVGGVSELVAANAITVDASTHNAITLNGSNLALVINNIPSGAYTLSIICPSTVTDFNKGSLNIKWEAGVEVELTNEYDIITLSTYDGGATWLGSFIVEFK